MRPGPLDAGMHKVYQRRKRGEEPVSYILPELKPILEHLSRLAKNAAEQVKSLGEPVALEPMNPFERKVVHDAVAALAGVSSESEGEEPNRYVVVHPEA